MSKKPSPAQIAARERFAAMARSGALARARKGAKRKKPTVGAGQVRHNPIAEHRAYRVEAWKRERNTVNGNPVYSFTLVDAEGYEHHGKTKPNAGFIYSLGSVSVGDTIHAVLQSTKGGRVYMTDAVTARKHNPIAEHRDGAYFKDLAIGERFERNGNVIVKTSSRTGAIDMPSETYHGKKFYYRDNEWCRLVPERKQNPLSRVKVKSPSQRTGNAPSKRLVSRRKATNKAPQGYYANPARVARVTKTRQALVGGIHYAVLFYHGKTKPTGKPDFIVPARDRAHAMAFARQIAEKGQSGLVVIEKTVSKV
jgi:hypothetical protein